MSFRRSMHKILCVYVCHHPTCPVKVKEKEMYFWIKVTALSSAQTMYSSATARQLAMTKLHCRECLKSFVQPNVLEHSDDHRNEL